MVQCIEFSRYFCLMNAIRYRCYGNKNELMSGAGIPFQSLQDFTRESLWNFSLLLQIRCLSAAEGTAVSVRATL